MKPLLLTFFTILGAMSSLLSQNKYDKMLITAEASYEAGNYKKAMGALEKFKSKVYSKMGMQTEYTPKYHYLAAKYNLATGHLQEFEIRLRNAITTSASINKENSEKHALLMINTAELYLQLGQYKVASDFLKDAERILVGDLMTEPVKARIEVDRAEVLTGQGYYNEALEILKTRERYYLGRAVKQDAFVDDKGNLKTRKLTEEEIASRYKDYARVLTLTGNAYGKQGKLISSDSAFALAARWISKNLGKSNEWYVRNQFYNANILVENGNETLPNDLEYGRLIDLMNANHAPDHYLSLEMYEGLLRQYLKAGQDARYLNSKLEYEKIINKNFKGRSIYHVRLKAMEFDARMEKNKMKNLDKEANAMVTNTSELPRFDRVSIQVNDFLYQLNVNEKDYKHAEQHLNEIIDIKSALYGDDAPETHLSRIQLANFYLDYTNKINEAAALYENSYNKVVAKQISEQHKNQLDILNHLAVLYEVTDRYADAQATLDKAALVARSKYDDKDYQYGAELTQIAQLQIKLGEYEKAEENLNKAFNILDPFRKEPDKKVFLINAIETQAKLFGIKGLFDEAEDALDRSAKIISKAERGLNFDELNADKELLDLYIQLGRYTASEEILEGLIPEYEKIYGKSSLRLIEPLVNSGKLSLAKGDYTEAEKIASRARDIALSVYNERSTKSAAVLELLSDIEYAIGDYATAETNILKALSAREKEFGRNHIDVAKSLGELALIKFYKGDNLDDVEKIINEARDIIGARLGKDNPQYAEILKTVATIKIAAKKHEQAFSALTQAESIWRTKTGSKRSIKAANIFTLTGDVHYQLKNYPKAEEFYNNAKSIYEKYFSNTHPEYVKVLSKQARVAYMQKDFKRSKRNIEEALNNYENFIKQYFPALSEREKAKYWNTIKGDYEFYNTLAFSQLEDFRDLTGKVYNYQLLTKALLLSSSIKIRERILASKDQALIDTYNLWIEKKEFLTNALSMSSEQLTMNGIDRAALGNEVENLERMLSEKSELFGQSFENKKVTYENVQKSLGKNEVAVEMVRYHHFNHTLTDSIVYVALYIENNNARPKVISLPEGYRMESRFFKFYRNTMKTKQPDPNSYNAFWAPIQKEIGQAATIYLSPDGIYNLLNLESIATPDGKYVIDNANIVIVSNTKDLYMRKLKKKVTVQNNKASMFGNPTFYLTASADMTIPPLPGTEIEVMELESLLKQSGWVTDEYMDVKATEEKVKELDNPKIFHIATHGFTPTPLENDDDEESITGSEAALLENPLLKTGLLLKGAGDVLNNAKNKYNYNSESGILTAYEAMNLNLDQTDLVVLSACETGLGEIVNGEGVYGLQRAFMVAGAKVLIMSMFKVDDTATQKLILNFYRKWLTSGNLRQSFTDAKKELRVEYPEPIYWGAFMMIGLD